VGSEGLKERGGWGDGGNEKEAGNYDKMGPGWGEKEKIAGKQPGKRVQGKLIGNGRK